MKALQRPARVAAVVGAVAAVGVGTVFAVGTASAAEQAEPAKCVENVNVREAPRIDAPVVALCEAGTVVEAGEVRNGFVKLTDLGGWSAQEYISINGQKPVTSGSADETADAKSGSTKDDTKGTAKDSDAETPSSRGRGGATDEETTGGSTKDAPKDAGTARGSRGSADDTTETADSTDSTDADSAAGKRSESRTNGEKDEEKTGAAPAPKPAAPAPGGGIIPGL